LTIDAYVPPHTMEEEWDIPALEKQLEQDFNLKLPLNEWLDEDEMMAEEHLRERVQAAFEEIYQKKEAEIGTDIMRQFEKGVMLQTLDNHWREHLAAMDYLRQGIHLRGYAQKNPKQEYKRECFEMFSALLDKVNHDVISALCKFEVKVEQDVQQMEDRQRETLNRTNMEYKHIPVDILHGDEMQAEAEVSDIATAEPFMRDQPKVGRNDPCPCGSGRKYKQCHGKLN